MGFDTPELSKTELKSVELAQSYLLKKRFDRKSSEGENMALSVTEESQTNTTYTISSKDGMEISSTQVKQIS